MNLKLLMNNEIHKYFQELGKKSSEKRWNGHVKRTKEEIREYNKLKQREYRKKKKDENKPN